MFLPRSLAQTRVPGRRLRALAVLVACLAAAGSACDDPGKTSGGPVNVLLISIDTLRADHTSAYGYEHPTTPTLESLAKQGVRIDAAYAPTSTTAPSHASLFTSLYPPTHRVIKNGRALADDHETLAEVLSRWGYQCGAVVSSYVLHGKFNYDQGFDTWDDDFSGAKAWVFVDGRPVKVRATEGGATRREDARAQGGTTEGSFSGLADDTTQRAIDWLEARMARQPFFLFVHYFDPHDPYDPPAGFAERFDAGEGAKSRRAVDRVIARYDGEIAYTDREIGRLLAALDALGLADETLVVATGDHGEGLMEHGHLNHGVYIYEEAVRVPLILRWPGRIAAGGRIATPVELTDVAPTILELVRERVAPPGDSGAGRTQSVRLDELLRAPGDPAEVADVPRGRSFAALLFDEDEAAERPVFLYRRHYEGAMVEKVWVEGERFGVREGRWKYIRGDPQASEELYDLESDPDERDDLSATFPDVARRLSQRLAQWRRSVSRGDGAAKPLPAEDRAALKALGYVE